MEIGDHHHVQFAGVAGGNHIGNEAGVGDGDQVVIQGLQAHGAQTNGDDFPIDIVKTHPVTNPEGPVKQQQQTGHQRRRNVLEGKAQSHGDGAAGGEHEFPGWLQYAHHQSNGTHRVENKADQGGDLQNQETAGGQFLGNFLAGLADPPVERPQHKAADKEQHNGVDVEQLNHHRQVIDDISIIH